MRKLFATLVVVVATRSSADAPDALGRGLQAVQSMAGCYLVDYSFVEVESLKPEGDRGVSRPVVPEEWRQDVATGTR